MTTTDRDPQRDPAAAMRAAGAPSLFDHMRRREPETPKPLFGGKTYSAEQDAERLLTQLERVRYVLSDGRWHTVAEVAEKVRGGLPSLSTRIRDLRKPEHGGAIVESRQRAGTTGLWEYRMIPQEPLPGELRPRGERRPSRKELERMVGAMAGVLGEIIEAWDTKMGPHIAPFSLADAVERARPLVRKD